MERLTESVAYPLTTFNRCQLCGFSDPDICYFRMWQECDDQDQPEPYKMIVLCKGKKCLDALEHHERAYRLVPWGQGAPGHLMLLCGNCTNRAGTHCTHPNLKANGGEGLLLHKFSAIKATVCYHDDTKEDGGLRCDREGFPSPFNQCEGFAEVTHSSH